MKSTVSVPRADILLREISFPDKSSIITLPVNVGFENIVALDSSSTFPKPTLLADKGVVKLRVLISTTLKDALLPLISPMNFPPVVKKLTPLISLADKSLKLASEPALYFVAKEAAVAVA